MKAEIDKGLAVNILNDSSIVKILVGEHST